jgi:hypothetical protein
LPRNAQPVPPIYQPEIAAEAVLHAADHPRRREYGVGGSTMGTLAANAIAPSLLDPNRPASRAIRTNRRTCGILRTAGKATTSARTVCSIPALHNAVRSCGPASTMACSLLS